MMMNLKQIEPTEAISEGTQAGAAFQRSPFRFLMVSVIALLVIGGGVVGGLMPRWRQQTELRAETRERSVPSVMVVFPKPGQTAIHTALPAEIKPWVEAPIYARVSGYLKQRYVDIGGSVKADQLLAVIDTPEQLQELERARGQLDQAEASLGISRITAARWAELLKTASVSEQDAAEKQADYKLKAALVASARAEVRRLEQIQAFSKVTAPFSGIITVRNVDFGDLIVAASGKELFHLAQIQKLRVFVQVPETMARWVHIGQSAELSLPDLPGRRFKATVIRTAGVVSADSRTLLVELAVDNPKGEILAGGYAQVRFTDAKVPALLMLPANTLLFRPEGPQIGIVQSDGKVILRQVQLGRDFGQTVEIVSGVTPKDRVIINPSDSLTSGTTVVVAESTSTGKKP
jgi:RND family efflux transporter MFP subunit